MEEAGDEDVSDALFTCPHCSMELPIRRRAAHDAYWCPNVTRPEQNSDEECLSEASSSSSDTGAGLGLGRDSLRRRCRRPEAEPVFQKRCPHGFIIGACAQCVEMTGSTEQSYHVGAVDPLAETSADARRRARLSFCFLVLTVAPALVTGFLFLQDFLNPLVLKVAEHDAERVQELFFGGGAWLVYCVNRRTFSSGEHLKVLTQAAEGLRHHGVRTAEVHCWTPLPTRKGPRTLAKRFRFRDSPPAVLFVSGQKKQSPQMLSADLSAEGLQRQVLNIMKRQANSAQPDSPRQRPASERPSKNGRQEYVGKRSAESDEDADTPFDTQVVDADLDSSREEVVDLDV
eukprot:TRINITY_DN63967_c0_g1_i1.p1 TRINITY_DN63967_c0_g1~~TRINITY_DN63967_c0_g1_i1.p1  ORF type:complete len:344 (-),score=62.40 TRINITY_DN63967_c0_g1_i1:4-1035(-)